MKTRPLKPFNPWIFAAFFLPLFLWWGAVLLALWPGFASADGLCMWRQAHGILPYSAGHPIICTLTWQLIWAIGGENMAAVPIVHLTLMAAVLAYAYSLLLRIGVPWRVILVAYALSLYSIKNALFSISILKDVPFAIAILALTILVAHLVYGRAREGWTVWFLIGLALAAAPLYRHNGLSVLVGMGVLLPFFFRPYWKKALFAFVAAVTMYGAVQIAAPVFGVVGRVSTNMVRNRNASLFDDYWEQHKYILWPGAEDRPRYKTIPNNPISGEIMQTVPWYSAIATICKEHGGTARHSFLPGLKAYLTWRWIETAKDERRVWWAWRYALCLYATLLAALVVFWREPRVLLIFAPVLLVIGGLLAIQTDSPMRYTFPASFATGFLVCLAFVPVEMPRLTRGIRRFFGYWYVLPEIIALGLCTLNRRKREK